jgi:hypothetical protein
MHEPTKILFILFVDFGVDFYMDMGVEFPM